jgi:transcriptional regulator with XRE-family HTH domain
MKKPKKSNLPGLIKAAREQKGLTLTETARRAGYTTQHMSRVENGHSPVTMELSRKVSKVLGAPKLLVVYWERHIQDLSQELKHARGALKEAKARAATTAR